MSQIWPYLTRVTRLWVVIIVSEVGESVFYQNTRADTVSDTKTLVLKHVTASTEYTRDESGVCERVDATHSLPLSKLFFFFFLGVDAQNQQIDYIGM